jgi:hypothetical protein
VLCGGNIFEEDTGNGGAFRRELDVERIHARIEKRRVEVLAVHKTA